MAEEKRILFVSNGYGEDSIAAHVAQEISRQVSTIKVSGFPTVGSGKFYTELGVPLAGRGLEMPSEGFVRSTSDFIKDVSSGLLFKTLRIGRSIRKVSKDYDFLVACGDPYLLLFASLFTKFEKSKKIFIGTLQSEWYGSKKPFKQHYSALERRWLKRFCSLIIARDEKTSNYLVKKGLVNAKSFGNPMMDCLILKKERVFSEDKTVIGILPGSKREAYDNFGNIIETIKELVHISGKNRDYFFTVAFSPNLDERNLIERFGFIKASDAKSPSSFSTYKIRGCDISLHFSNSRFGNIIFESNAVIGLSGTGNEQAAGFGKPVFAFWGGGPQITRKFLLAQKKLLGISLFVFPPDPPSIAKEIDEVLSDRDLLKKIEENGKLRMGGTGSVKLIARETGEYVINMEG
jgi:uncharacterized protein (TIGR03492 family)